MQHDHKEKKRKEKERKEWEEKKRKRNYKLYPLQSKATVPVHRMLAALRNSLTVCPSMVPTDAVAMLLRKMQSLFYLLTEPLRTPLPTDAMVMLTSAWILQETRSLATDKLV